MAGQAPSAAAISAALSAAFSGAPSSAAPAAADAAAAAADPDAADERVAPTRRAGLPAGPLPAGEGLLGRPAGPPRQSSAPDTLLSARWRSIPLLLSPQSLVQQPCPGTGSSEKTLSGLATTGLQTGLDL